MPRRIPAAIVLGFPIWLTAAPTVHSDEAYICDGGRIVYVKHGELEHLKRTDACIAGYYGVTIEPAVTVSASATTAPADTTSAAKGLALERAAIAKLGGNGSDKSPQPSAKGASPLPAEGKRTRTAKPLPVPAPNTDFRNVLIINAAPGEARVFRHER